MLSQPRTPLDRGTRVCPPALVAHDTLIFLEGVAWDHTAITYAILPSLGVDPDAIAAVKRAVGNWNSAIGAAPSPRLRDFRLEPARTPNAADIEIRISAGGPGIEGIVDLGRTYNGALSHVVVSLGGRALGADPNLGAVVTEAVRQIGHALGVGYSAAPDDPMYPAHNGVKLRPSAADVEAFAAVERWYVTASPTFCAPRPR